MKNKHIFSLMILIILTILLSSQVTSFGLAPAKKILNFEPGMSKTIDFSILSKGDSQGFFTIVLQGDLEKYATLDKNSAFLDFEETKETFSLKLNLPQELPQGPNELTVLVIEQDPDDTTTVNVQNAIAAQIIVNVPYDGISVESVLNAEKINVGEPLTLTISLFGRGEIPAQCYATIDIKTPANELIDTLVTGKQIVAQAEAKKIDATWKNTQNKGLYQAEATVHCEDQIQVLRKQFYVGNPSVSVLSIVSDKFILGQIAPIDITMRNNWNQKFNDVYVEILVLSDTGTILQQFKSPSEGMDADDVKTVTAYWETETLQVGDYNLNVVTYFDKTGVNQEKFIAHVETNKLLVNKITGNVVNEFSTEGKDSTSKISFLILIVALLIGINIAIIVYFKTKKN